MDVLRLSFIAGTTDERGTHKERSMQKQLAADKKASRSNTSPLTCRDQARRTKEEWFLDSFLSWLLAKAAIPEGTRKDRPNPSLHPTYTALLFHPSRKARQLKHQAEFSLSQNCWLALPTSTFSEHPKALIFVLTWSSTAHTYRVEAAAVFRCLRSPTLAI